MTQTFQIQNGDVVIDRVNGQIVMVADAVKLRQDLQENLSIEIQTNGFGTGLTSVIGKLGDEFSVRAEVGRLVRQSIDRMKVLQSKMHRQQRPSNERILAISNLIVSPIKDKKTTFAFRVDVTTEAGTTVTSTSLIG